MKSEIQQRILDMVQTKKADEPNHKRMKTIFSYLQPACAQNIAQNPEWRKGDPNPETSPTYDFVWVVWILRQILPKDVITHFINLNGGFNFVTQHNMYSRKNTLVPKLYLMYWKDDIHHLVNVPKRNIYFNLPVHKIQMKKEKHYLLYKDGKTFYIHGEDVQNKN